MCLDATLFLPKSLRTDLLCFTSHGLDDSPDITSCHSNGFIYEVKNQKIVRSLNLELENVSSLSVYYFYETEGNIMYYLVFAANSNLLLVLKRTNTYFEVTQKFNDVAQFKVFDFKSKGYPQLQIVFFQSSECEIFEFSVCAKVQEPLAANIEESHSNSCIVANCMEEKLQMINMHIDELLDESIQIKKIIVNESKTSTEDLRLAFCSSVRVCFRSKKTEMSEIKLVNKWHKNFGRFWIFGARLLNSSEKTLPDLQLLVIAEKLKKFAYCFFSLPNFATWPSKHSSSIQPGQELLVIGAFEMPAFIVENKISINCFLTSLDCSENVNLKLDEIELNALDILTPHEIQFAADDVMAMMTTHAEINLLIETENDVNCLLESTLMKLGFGKIEFPPVNFFYSQSNEVGIVLKQMSAFPFVWKSNIYTRSHHRVYLLVNALYDVLPEKTTILHCEK